MRALNTAATGMMAQELNVEVIANNIANMRTTGYKRQRAEFQDMLYEHVRRIGVQTSTQGNILPVGVDIGSGVKTVGTPRIITQGTLTQTGGPLNVAIQGDGYFKIQLPDGTFAYTRDGSFQMDAQGRIVTAQGNLVQPGITIPPNSSALTINSQGQVSVIQQGNTNPTILGQFTLTSFINATGLLPIGDNLCTETPASGPPPDRARRRQRPQQPAAGQPRAVERRARDRDLRPDLGAAPIRDEFQGDQRRRPDAADHLGPVSLDPSGRIGRAPNSGW